MNKKATYELIKSKHVNLRSWCRSNGFSYGQVYQFIARPGNPFMTLQQTTVADALRRDGLLVEDEQ